MSCGVIMEKASMRKRPVAVGDAFHKSGRPRAIWSVERFNLDARLPHVVLARVDDPTTKITVSEDTVSNPFYFRRSVAPTGMAG